MGIPQVSTPVQSPCGPFPPRSTPLFPPPGMDLDPAHWPVVRCGRLWVPQEAVSRLPSWLPDASPVARARAQVEQGRQGETAHRPERFTEHALLIAWGDFAAEIGLLSDWRQLHLPQKSVVHTPPAKLLSFFLGLLSGMTHFQDLHAGPHPLAHDRVALRAWGLLAMADGSGISRTLAACDDTTVQAVTALLHAIAQPFIAQEVRFLQEQHQPLVIDLDLAPRPVCNTSTTFPGAEFGWQGHEVGLGYEVAWAALTSPSYGRLLLEGFPHPRNTVLLPALQRMIAAVEERLGGRPRRRTELVQQRLQAARQRLEQRLGWWNAQLQVQRELLADEACLPALIARLEKQVAMLVGAAPAPAGTAQPSSALARARQQLARAQQQWAQLPQRLQQARQAVATHRARADELQAEYDALRAYLTQLEADNAAHPTPFVITLRLDAGFGSGANLTWLIEQGYALATKAHNASVTTRLLPQVPATATWQRVGRNAEMLALGEARIDQCPYPLSMGLERFQTPAGIKHSTLIAYPPAASPVDVQQWFDFYNARQIVEAGIKEGNVVFQMHPLKLRSRGGIALQEQFCLFAANFVRWAMKWLAQRVQQNTPRFTAALHRVKAMVRVGANTSAWVLEDEGHLLLRFDEIGAYPGVEIQLPGVWRFLPLLLPPEQVRKPKFRSDPASGCT